MVGGAADRLGGAIQVQFDDAAGRVLENARDEVASARRDRRAGFHRQDRGFAHRAELGQVHEDRATGLGFLKFQPPQRTQQFDIALAAGLLVGDELEMPPGGRIDVLAELQVFFGMRRFHRRAVANSDFFDRDSGSRRRRVRRDIVRSGLTANAPIDERRDETKRQPQTARERPT